jgi:hypothetical protein
VLYEIDILFKKKKKRDTNYYARKEMEITIRIIDINKTVNQGE